MALLAKFAAFALACLPAAAVAENYLGILKPPRDSRVPSGSFSIASEPIMGFSAYRGAEGGQRMKLGYKYSRYFSVEGQFVDFGRAPADVFASPGNLASAFRSTGFGVDTVATLPVWRSLSFYGRMGAYRGETRNAFASYSSSLLTEQIMRGSRMRYGLGVRYDFSKAFGIHAEFERNSPLGTPLAGEPEADVVSVGVMWRF